MTTLAFSNQEELAMLATETSERQDELHYLQPGDERPQFSVVVKPTDVEGTNYLKIDVRRTFKSTGEVNAWMNACVARLTAELHNLIEAEDDDND